MKRVAVIYDNRPRPETTGLYCRRALGELVLAGVIESVEHLLPDELDRVSKDQFDLFLYVDDGLQQSIRDDLRPAVWWGIDSHLDFERCLQMASLCDFTFTTQRDGAERLRDEGVKTAQWLPLACDPKIHGQRDVQNEHDIAFVGHIFPGPRQKLLEQISEKFSRTFVGQRYFKEMAETYSASKIVFNRSIRNDINMRVFEGLCSGSLLLTNDLAENGQSELIQEGVHYAAFRDADELQDKLSYYLEHDDLREQIAAAGREHVLKLHTYRHRMETILRVVEQQQAGCSTTVPVASLQQHSLPQKENFYFEFDRPDVQALVPTTAKNILDVGCGGGRLGEALKQRQKTTVTGLERDPVAAERASQRIDQVITGDMTTNDVEFAENSFDCVICADVLEHMRDPEAVLRKIRRWLTPDGQLVTSLPNVRNHTVVRSLLAGNWTYEPAGLLDEDHVRFFTKREIEKLLFRTGFDVAEMRAIGGDGYQEWVQQGRSQQLSIGPFQLRASSVEEAEEFFAYQYLTRSTPSSQPKHALTSIILVTHNQLSYTKECLESIRMRTTAPYELIVVDNGSSDQTVDYLRACDDVQLIENNDNRGFPAAANQGIEAANGENILLLNNDTLVTTGWLTRMLETLHSSPEVGLVGPLSNNISGSQQVEVTYDDLAQLDGFAWELSKRQRNVRISTDRLVGFCLLFKREVSDRIGLLDERFGIGNFEDDDFCRRAEKSGYQSVIATDSFVHHFGSVTFKGSGVDFGGLLHENQKIYNEKWNGNGSNGVSRSSEPQLKQAAPSASSSLLRSGHPKFLCDVSDDGALLLKENNVHLSACLIVRDNEKTIRPCLESLSPWVDEIIVVDTGSTDRTPEICAELGARVYHWPWCDDFAAARNESLKYARGEWIFWMDSDDTIPSACGQSLRNLADGEHPTDKLGYVMQVHCPGIEPTDVTVVDHVKLFRNRGDLNFEFRIHEQILPSIRRAGGEVEFTEIYVVHSGATKDAAGRARKLERDFKLLQLENEERPDHPFTLFNLGMTYADDNQHETAINCLNRCIEVSGKEESHLRKAYALLVSSLNQSGQNEEALHTCHKALALFSGDKELLFRRAMLEHQSGQLEAAVNTYQQVLDEQSDRHFTSIDTGIASHKARHNLAIVYEELGDLVAAQTQWKTITETHPDYRPGWRGLVDLLLKRDMVDIASELVLWLQNDSRHMVVGHILAAQIAERSGDIDKAVATLKCLLSSEAADYEAHDAYCRMLFENGMFDEANEALQRLLQVDPSDASAHHNLAAVCEQLGEPLEAIKHYERSLQLRPDSLTTAGNLRSLKKSVQINKSESDDSMQNVLSGHET